MKNITFERIMLCVIAAGVWTIASLYIYEFFDGKYVYVGDTVNTNSYISEPLEVKVVNEVDAFIVNQYYETPIMYIAFYSIVYCQ